MNGKNIRVSLATVGGDDAPRSPGVWKVRTA